VIGIGVPVVKMNGTHNEFAIVDARLVPLDDPVAFARRVCDRERGLGADGLLIALPSATADVRMRIINADGSEAEMCGNGVRCVARYRFERTPGAPKRLALRTQAGLIHAEVVDASAASFAVRVAMGVPELVTLWDEPGIICGLPVFGADVLIGNPHCVVFVQVDPATVDLGAIAAEIESENAFADGVNVEVARLLDNAIDMRVHERGVGETMACGTGACAVALAAISMGKARSPVGVSMRGGDVVVEWAGPESEAFLTGGAEIVFHADVDVPDTVTAAAGAIGT